MGEFMLLIRDGKEHRAVRLLSKGERSTIKQNR